MYAIFFYHIMEFISETPPQNLVPYFLAEGPYFISLALLMTKCVDGLHFAMNRDEIVKIAVKKAFEDSERISATEIEKEKEN